MRTLKAPRSMGVASSQCVPALELTRLVASKTLPVARWILDFATNGVGDRQDARVRLLCIVVWLVIVLFWACEHADSKGKGSATSIGGRWLFLRDASTQTKNT